MADKVKIGIIGGSGLYGMEGLSRTKEVRVATPFGKPSDTYLLGTVEGTRVAFWRGTAGATAFCLRS